VACTRAEDPKYIKVYVDIHALNTEYINTHSTLVNQQVGRTTPTMNCASGTF